MVLAEDAAAAVEVVFVQVTGGLDLAQLAQGDGQVVGGVQGVRVVLAEDAAAAVEGVFVQVTRGLELTQLAQGDGQVVGGVQGVRVVWPTTRRRRSSVSSLRSRAAWTSPSSRRS